MSKVKVKSNPIFESNIRALKKRQPLLAQKMIDISNTRDPYPLEKKDTKRGSWWGGFYEKPFFQSKSSLSITPEGHKPVLVVAGIGVPEYLVNLLNKSKKRKVIILIEENIKLLLFALESVSFFTKEGEGSIYFIMGDDEILLKEMMTSAYGKRGFFVGGLCDFVFNPGEMELASYSLKRNIKKYKDYIVYQMQRLGDSAEDTLLGFRQMALSTPWILSRETLKPLKDKFKGFSGVVLSAGPSLDKNIEQLRGREHDLVIVAADTLLGKLSEMGIKPHFVCALERGPLTYEKYFKPLYDRKEAFLDDIVLVVQSVCHPQIAGRWPGKLCVVGKEHITLDKQVIEGALGGTLLESGASVAHMALGLLSFLGVDKVALIGQDLAFADDGRTHSSHTPWSESGGVETRHEKITVRGSLQPEVTTTKIWKLFIDIFEDMAKYLDLPIWDCTEGGALIRGTHVAPLSDFLSETIDKKGSYFLLDFSINNEKGEFNSLEGLGRVKNMFLYSLDRIKEGQELLNGMSFEGEDKGKKAESFVDLLQDLADKNSILTYIGQSYLAILLGYELSLDLSKRDDFDLWLSSHLGFFEAQKKSAMIFLNWLNYMIFSVENADAFVDSGIKERVDEESIFSKITDVLSGFTGQEGIEFIAFLDFFMSRVDWISLGKDKVELILKMSSHLYGEGRYLEASKSFQAAIENLEGKNTSIKTASFILKERAKCLMGRDLCWGGQPQEALVSLANAYRYTPDDDELLKLLEVLICRRIEDMEDIQLRERSEEKLDLFRRAIENLKKDLKLLAEGDPTVVDRYLVNTIEDKKD